MSEDLKQCDTNVKLKGKVALVTGATSGTGLEIAKNLAKRGAKVIIASRNRDKLENAKTKIEKAAENAKVTVGTMDLASLSSVRKFAEHTLATETRLDILINNAGAIGLEDKLTADNLHTMMQVNYFGTFLLTYLLFPLMKRSAPSRIINISSLALVLGTIDMRNMNQVGQFSSFGFYSNAKLAEVLFTVEMNKRIKGSGVSVYSLDPGLIKSDFFRHFDDGIAKFVLTQGLNALGRPAQVAAKVPVYLATEPKLNKSSGKHFKDCGEFYSSWYAEDAKLTYVLWEESKKLVKITEDEDWE